MIVQANNNIAQNSKLTKKAVYQPSPTLLFFSFFTLLKCLVLQIIFYSIFMFPSTSPILSIFRDVLSFQLCIRHQLIMKHNICLCLYPIYVMESCHI